MHTIYRTWMCTAEQERWGIKQLFRITQESLLISGNNSKNCFQLTPGDFRAIVMHQLLWLFWANHTQQWADCKYSALVSTKPCEKPGQCWDRVFWKWSAKLMSTDSWEVCSECEDKDVDCVRMDMCKGVQWWKTGSENRRQVSNGRSGDVVCNRLWLTVHRGLCWGKQIHILRKEA